MSSTIFRTKVYKWQSLCVYGYLRAESNNRYFPDELKQLCLLMYAEVFDEWDMSISSDGLQVDEHSNELSVRQIDNAYDMYRWRNAFGDFVIGKGQFMEWTFKLTAKGTDVYERSVFFGILEAEKCNANLQSYFCNPDIAYLYGGLYGAAYYAFDGCAFIGKAKRKTYADRCGKGDNLTMILDMTQSRGVLRYKINDVDQGIMIDTIDIERKYRMAVSMHRHWEIIKLFRSNDAL